MAKDSAVRIELGRSFHQMGTVNEKVSESDCASLEWYSNASFTCRSAFESAYKSEVLNIGKGVQSQRCSVGKH